MARFVNYGPTCRTRWCYVRPGKAAEIVRSTYGAGALSRRVANPRKVLATIKRGSYSKGA